MSLAGTGVFLFWTYVEKGYEDDFDLWHLREHFVERLAVPGVLRVRRYVSDREKYRYFLIYELESSAVMASPAYQQSLAYPSAWTDLYRPPGVATATRYGCFVALSVGAGIGSRVATALIRLPKDVKRPWITAREQLTALLDRQAITGVHFVIDDGAVPASQRGGFGQGTAAPDLPPATECVLILEGFDRARLDAALPDAEAAVRRAFPTAEPFDWRCYDFHYVMTQDEARKTVPFKRPE